MALSDISLISVAKQKTVVIFAFIYVSEISALIVLTGMK
jgi:hypothetical protein